MNEAHLALNLRPGESLETGGVKADAGKIRMDLIPVSVIYGIAEVLTYGAAKYSDRNWEKGMLWSRPYGAALRHLTAFWDGEDLDPETEIEHLKHAACNLAFLIEYLEKGKGEDDRPDMEEHE